MTRFMLYSHDTYGLGHLRRSLLLAEALVAADPRNEVLVATGSPQAQAFSLPDRVDSLKLPSATKDGSGAYQPRKLGGSLQDLVALRSGVKVLWATGNPGYDVSIQPESPGFKVEFRSDDHRSRLDVWWSGGPRHTIREEPS